MEAVFLIELLISLILGHLAQIFTALSVEKATELGRMDQID